MNNQDDSASQYWPPPATREHFVQEIGNLLDEVPAEQWADQSLLGIRYDFCPWHRMSSLTIQTYDDDPHDPASWKYYFSAESDGSLLDEEYAAWHNEQNNKRLVYHRLLIEAAEAFLSLEFGKHGNPYWAAIRDEFCLNRTFLLQVFDLDKTFQFNYCDYVVARRLERS